METIKQIEIDRIKFQHQKYKKSNYRDENILAATWIDSIGVHQKEMDEKPMFFSNESILMDQNLRNHFSKKHMKLFHRNHMQEFVCLKGNNLNGAHEKSVNPQFYCQGYDNHQPDCFSFTENKHSFFSICESRIKIIGVFDGHGVDGHYTSCAAMGLMLDYLRNKNDVFTSKNINNGTLSSDEILLEIKKAFRYVQNVLKEDYLINKHFKEEFK